MQLAGAGELAPPATGCLSSGGGSAWGGVASTVAEMAVRLFSMVPSCSLRCTSVARSASSRATVSRASESRVSALVISDRAWASSAAASVRSSCDVCSSACPLSSVGEGVGDGTAIAAGTAPAGAVEELGTFVMASLAESAEAGAAAGVEAAVVAADGTSTLGGAEADSRAPTSELQCGQNHSPTGMERRWAHVRWYDRGQPSQHNKAPPLRLHSAQ